MEFSLDLDIRRRRELNSQKGAVLHCAGVLVD
jgi:hypothetical protein